MLSANVSGLETSAEGIFARVQVAGFARYGAGRGHLRIPFRTRRVFVEIGASDRDTLDVELLDAHDDAFLVTLEPLIEKYARGLARRGDVKVDGFQALGSHHKRGLRVAWTTMLPLRVVALPRAFLH